MGPTPGHSLVSGSRGTLDEALSRPRRRSARLRMRSNSGRLRAPRTKRGPVAGESVGEKRVLRYKRLHDHRGHQEAEALSDSVT